MRARIRRILLGAVTSSATAASAMMAVAACSSGDQEDATPAPDAAIDVVDASSPPEASADARPGIDARPPFDAAPEPVTCTATPCAVELVAGDYHYCARMSDGTVRCWGDDIWGQLGRGESGDGETPPDAGDAGPTPPVVGLTNVVQISAGANVTCALLTDGNVQCWGANHLGGLGLATDPPELDDNPHPSPSPVALGGAIATRVDVGDQSACALLTTGKLVCWGNTQFMKLARPDAIEEGPLPIIVGPGEAVLDASGFAKTFASTKTMFAVTKTGEVFSWGAISGEDGVVSGRVSSKSPSLAPKPVEQLANVTNLAVSSILWRDPGFVARDRPGGPRPPPHAHGCAIANGDVFCWGHSFTGALGTGLPDREHLPKRAPIFATAWPQQIAVGDETTCVRMTDGTVQCCGENTNGALGTGSVNGFGAFFAPATALTSHVVQIAASQASFCALAQGGTVECWGGNSRGELGRIPDHVGYPTPMKITF